MLLLQDFPYCLWVGGIVEFDQAVQTEWPIAVVIRDQTESSFNFSLDHQLGKDASILLGVFVLISVCLGGLVLDGSALIHQVV